MIIGCQKIEYVKKRITGRKFYMCFNITGNIWAVKKKEGRGIMKKRRCYLERNKKQIIKQTKKNNMQVPMNKKTNKKLSYLYVGQYKRIIYTSHAYRCRGEAFVFDNG